MAAMNHGRMPRDNRRSVSKRMEGGVFRNCSLERRRGRREDDKQAGSPVALRFSRKKGTK